MQLITFALGLAYSISAARASPLAVESRQAATCPDFGTNLGGAPIASPTDAEASLCCVYGQSIAHCCRNKSFEDDAYWSRALPCDSPWWENSGKFGDFYVCQVDNCREGCEDVPYVFDERCERE